MKTNPFFRMLQLAKKAFAINLFISLPVYAFILVLFYDFGFSVPEWSAMLLKTVLSGWLVIYLSMTVCDGVEKLGQWFLAVQSKRSLSWRRLTGAVPLLALALLLHSCKGGIQPFGKRVDLATGLTTNYTGIMPAETRLIMNNEELDHAGIPLGEKFTIVNSGVEGLTVKDNKVSIGCSLSISDKNGAQVLYEPDLFKTTGVFDKDSAGYLQCKVNTGAPMEWEKKYLVKIIYWDKFGTGKLENALTISMENEP